MSSTLSYTNTKSVLSEVEKERIICTYLNSTEPNAVSLPVPLLHSPIPSANHPKINWDKAASEYGAASVESYKKGLQNTIKKIRKSMDSGVGPEAAEASPAKKGAGKKRKEKTVETDDEAEVEESPLKKKKGGRKTKAQKAAAAGGEEDGDVKAEESE
jgi:hypothetical protein